MSYTVKDHNGRSKTIISDIKSFPGKNITQKQWDDIFGKRKKREYYKSKSYYKGNDKYIEDEWYEEVTGKHIKINVVYKNNMPISYKENDIEVDLSISRSIK